MSFFIFATLTLMKTSKPNFQSYSNIIRMKIKALIMPDHCYPLLYDTNVFIPNENSCNAASREENNHSEKKASLTL